MSPSVCRIVTAAITAVGATVPLCYYCCHLAVVTCPNAVVVIPANIATVRMRVTVALVSIIATTVASTADATTVYCYGHSPTVATLLVLLLYECHRCYPTSTVDI